VSGPFPQIANTGDPATFMVNVTGTAPFTYQWFKNNVLIPGAIGSSLTIPNAQCSDAGSYTATISNPAGSAASGPAILTVNDTQSPTLTLPANITAEATTPSGAVVTYNASASDNCDAAVTPACNPASGSTFPIGLTTVNCTASDSHANTAM